MLGGCGGLGSLRCAEARPGSAWPRASAINPANTDWLVRFRKVRRLTARARLSLTSRVVWSNTDRSILSAIRNYLLQNKSERRGHRLSSLPGPPAVPLVFPFSTLYSRDLTHPWY